MLVEQTSCCSDKINSIVLECQEWWQGHCLYLTADAREAFRLAFSFAWDHRSLGRSADVDLMKENYETIAKAGDAIVSGVELPSLGEREAEHIVDQTQPNQSDTR